MENPNSKNASAASSILAVDLTYITPTDIPEDKGTCNNDAIPSSQATSLKG